jgi:hypothetical protein
MLYSASDDGEEDNEEKSVMMADAYHYGVVYVVTHHRLLDRFVVLLTKKERENESERMKERCALVFSRSFTETEKKEQFMGKASTHFSNLAECTPTKTTARSAYLCSSSASSGST